MGFTTLWITSLILWIIHFFTFYQEGPMMMKAKAKVAGSRFLSRGYGCR
jgi:hypothetical protein